MADPPEPVPQPIPDLPPLDLGADQILPDPAPVPEAGSLASGDNEMLSKFLAGKKTYIAAVVALLGVIAAYLQGQMDLASAIEAAVTAVLAVTLRAGIKSDTRG